MFRLFILALIASYGLSVSAQNVNTSFVSKTTYAGQNLSNIWGYAIGTSEYALIGGQFGMIVTDVTNPTTPVQITQIAGANSSWREIRTYLNYAYIATEGGGGLQIVDLTNLPGTNLTTYTYTGGGTTPAVLNKIHALQVDETKGFLYLYGTNIVGGRALVFDINGSAATAPIYKGYYNPIGYVHDGYVDNDIMYAAHISAGKVSIVNMANKTGPLIGVDLCTPITTPLAFPHNTWLMGSYMFTTDEKPNSTLTSYDISNYSNITLLDKIQSNPGSNSIVHNTYIRDGYAITSWYKDGFTIVDVSRPDNMVQVGDHDTYPGSGNGFEGAWGVYPYLPSGNILVSNMFAQGTNNGEMWIIDPTYVRGCYVEGIVTAANTGYPLPNATVQLLSTTTMEQSNSSGVYKMGRESSGTYTLRVSKSGYVTQDISVTLSNGTLTTTNVALLSLLPVELTSFDAEVSGNTAILDWETAQERNSKCFEIQHLDPQKNWVSVGTVPAAGNSDSALKYHFEVSDLEFGVHYFRLRQLDLDGKEDFSDIETIEITKRKYTATLQPNVTDNRTILHLDVEKPAHATVEILAITGQPLGLRSEVEVERHAEIELSIGHLPMGSYLVKIDFGGYQEILRLMRVER